MFMNFFTLGILGFIMILLAPFIIISIIAKWKLFKKVGRNGWESLIPIYDSWVLVEIAGLNWCWFLLLVFNFSFSGEIEGFKMAINMCGFLGNFNCYYNIARRFGKDKTTSIFAGIFPFIFILIFGFSKNEVYDINIPVSINGIFGGEEHDYGNNSNYHDDMNKYNNDSVNQQVNDENMRQSTNSVDNDNREYSYCGNCGLKLDKDVNFCPNCGREKR